MRIAFVSDIHSNDHALGAVLDHLAGQGASQLYCLGDIVGYNAHPNQCIAMLRKADALAVKGNHDWAATDGPSDGFNVFAVEGIRHSRKVLTEEHARWLRQLPAERRVVHDGTPVAMYHGSPRDPMLEYVFPFADAGALQELARAAGSPRVIALGHTHLPMRRDHQAVFVNPGSVGQPRDGDPRASYLTLDTTTLETEFHRVDYDVDSAARSVREAGLPDFLWQRLLQGV